MGILGYSEKSGTTRGYFVLFSAFGTVSDNGSYNKRGTIRFSSDFMDYGHCAILKERKIVQ